MKKVTGLLLMLLLVLACAAALGDVAVNSTNFPDSKLLTFASGQTQQAQVQQLLIRHGLPLVQNQILHQSRALLGFGHQMIRLFLVNIDRKTIHHLNADGICHSCSSSSGVRYIRMLQHFIIYRFSLL